VIILDTNVLSETMLPRPSGTVLAWLASPPPETVYVTAITQAEILTGIECMADGRRRKDLLRRAEAMFAEDFSGRILPFESAAAPELAWWVALRQRQGRRVREFDAEIAAIARVHRAALATRNMKDFEGCGVELIDPWKWTGKAR
jgi:hypothetical protein